MSIIDNNNGRRIIIMNTHRFNMQVRDGENEIFFIRNSVIFLYIYFSYTYTCVCTFWFEPGSCGRNCGGNSGGFLHLPG